MDRIVAVDFGSTFTKAALFDCGAGCTVATARAPSTASSDVTLGLQRVLRDLAQQSGTSLARIPALACSSAAGGLRVAVIGLVPALSLEAARRASLGAGARIVGAYGYKLTGRMLSELETARPDIVVLAGGTDGGDEDTILHNAAALARSTLVAPIVVAGNASVADACVDRLRQSGKDARCTSNLLPEVGRIDPGPVHDAMRELFIRRITHAKGIDRAREQLDLVSDIVPTPSAVLDAARLIAEGTAASPGLGDTVIVDVGGATTDVYSVASGAPSRPGVVVRGLPELKLKRTVEGDLGVRINAPSVLDRFGPEHLVGLARTARAATPLAAEALGAYATRIADRTAHLPESVEERAYDDALGRAAVRMAVERHAGRLREIYTPSGPMLVLEGKDLTDVAAVVGIGGVLAHGGNPRFVLEGVLDAGAHPYGVLPRDPALYLDRRYVLFGVGLLSTIAPGAALAIARESLGAV